MDWTYPTREDDPWWDGFQDFVNATDGSAFAGREDRSIIWSGGGTLSWTLSSGTLSWTDTINIYSPMSAKLLQIAAGSIAGLADGEVVYVDLTRLALVNTAKTLHKATALPSTDDAMAVAVRIGNTIFFRTGISLGDGDTATGIAPVPGTGGGGTDPNAIHKNVAAEISTITEKVSPVAADLVVIEDSADSNNKKRAQVGNLPVPTHHTTHESGGGDAIKLDDLAAPDDNTDLNATTSAHGLLSKLPGGTTNFLRADGSWAAPPGGTDPNAIHTNVSAEINGLGPKVTPVGADELVIEDSATGYSKKKILISSLPGGAASVRAAPRIMVGNGPNGDLAADCDYLDSGDCAQLALAIAAAGPGDDVYIKPGTYDFGQVGSPASRITIPAGARVRGAGRKHVTIQTRAAGGDGGALLLGGDGAALEDVRIYSPELTASQSGTPYALVEVDSDDCDIERVDIEFAWTVASAAYNQIDTGLYVNGPVTDFRAVDVKILNVPKFYQEVPSTIMYGFYLSGVAWAFLRGIYVSGGDTGGVLSNAPAEFHEMLFDSFKHEGLIIEGSDWSNIIGGRFIQDGTWTTARAIQAGTSADFITYSDLSFQVTGASTAQAAIYTYFSDRCIIKGCRGDGKWSGNGFIRFDSSADYNLVQGCQFNGNAPQDIGTGNQFDHNML
jgi:hypothetical protein